MKTPAFAILLLVLLAGCVSETRIETKVPDQAIKSDALSRAVIHTERAAEYYRIGRTPVALEAAESAVALNVPYAPAYSMLGIIQMSLGEDAKAQAAFEHALKIAPNDSESLNNYGWFICQRKDPVKSLQYFDLALKNPVYATPEKALNNGAICARMAGNLVGAETRLQEALRRRPNFVPALHELAEVRFLQKRYTEADALLNRYSEGVPAPSVEALYLGVRVARALGDKSTEASYVQQLRRRFPDAPQTASVMSTR